MFVQLDGVSFPVMQWVLQSGTMPTLRRWLDNGSHAVHEWTCRCRVRRPASQQAILQGSADGVPAFRWYDRDLGRVLVANRPEDASIIETRASTGHGLLADDGVSISNLFTGDAPKAAMTMSRLEVSRGSRRTRQVFARFLIRPDGLVRSFSRTVAEVVRERFQAVAAAAAGRASAGPPLLDVRRPQSLQQLPAARPQHRRRERGDDARARAASTSTTSTTTRSGTTPGPRGSSRWPRSAASTRWWPSWRRWRERAPRNYHLVLLSDHGQSQGEPFASRYGIELSDLCRSLTHSETTGIEGSIEGWGRVDSVLEDLGGTGTTGAQQAASRRVDKVLKPKGSDAEDAELIVLAGGNMGMVYVPVPERLLLEEIEARWPALIPGLVAHPGVGFVSALSATGPVAIGEHGRHHLSTGAVEGVDPLLTFGDHAPAMLATATLMARAPELYVNSAFDLDTMDVAAFEPLVGCHGGLGGWQDRGFVLAPPHLFAPSTPIMGGDELHQHLVGILDGVGAPDRTQEEHPMSATSTATPAVTPSRTTLMLVSAAAFVIVVVGLKAANHIVAPVFLSVALVIVFYPLRARLERRMPVVGRVDRRADPSPSCCSS